MRAVAWIALVHTASSIFVGDEMKKKMIPIIRDITCDDIIWIEPKDYNDWCLSGYVHAEQRIMLAESNLARLRRQIQKERIEMYVQLLDENDLTSV